MPLTSSSHPLPEPGRSCPLKLSVIIVNWNVRDLLLECIRSLREQTRLAPEEWELIVVDNASQDGSVEAVRALDNTIRVIANQENCGFGAANNQAYRVSRGEAILLLNPDTLVLDHAADRMLAALERQPRTGIIGCRLLNPDHTPQRWTGGHLPSLGNVFCHFLFLYRVLPAWLLPRPLYLESDPARDLRTGWVSGAALMIRRQALEAAAHPDGIFSSDYFLYGEDMDLCRRIARASWDIVYSPSAAIVHYEGQSLTQQTLEIQGSKLRGLRTVFQADHGRFAVLLFDLISAAGFGLRYTLNRLGAVVMPGRGFSAQAELSRQRLAETLRPLTRGRRTTP